jgi:hypothetical protein
VRALRRRPSAQAEVDAQRDLAHGSIFRRVRSSVGEQPFPTA